MKGEMAQGGYRFMFLGMLGYPCKGSALGARPTKLVAGGK